VAPSGYRGLQARTETQKTRQWQKKKKRDDRSWGSGDANGEISMLTTASVPVPANAAIIFAYCSDLF
jgi:hypothetical protein